MPIGKKLTSGCKVSLTVVASNGQSEKEQSLQDQIGFKRSAAQSLSTEKMATAVKPAVNA